MEMIPICKKETIAQKEFTIDRAKIEEIDQ